MVSFGRGTKVEPGDEKTEDDNAANPEGQTEEAAMAEAKASIDAKRKIAAVGMDLDMKAMAELHGGMYGFFMHVFGWEGLIYLVFVCLFCVTVLPYRHARSEHNGYVHRVVDMCVDMCIDMCINDFEGMCIDKCRHGRGWQYLVVCLFLRLGYLYRHVYTHVAWICKASLHMSLHMSARMSKHRPSPTGRASPSSS